MADAEVFSDAVFDDSGAEAGLKELLAGALTQEVDQLLASGVATYPEAHQAAMRVPKGGSSCASCEYLADNGEDCTNEYFQKWHGSEHLPAPADEYCSDWYEPKKEIEAYGTSEGAEKGWDTRGRGQQVKEVGRGGDFSDLNQHRDFLNERREDIENLGLDDPDNHDYTALAHMATALDMHLDTPLSQKAGLRTAFAFDENNNLVAGGAMKLLDKHTAEITNLGSQLRGAGAPVVNKLLEQARERGIRKVQLTSTARGFYERLGFKLVDKNKMELDLRNWRLLDAAIEELLAQALFNNILIEGFTRPEEEFVRASLSRVPVELTTGVTKVIADRGMGAKHGNYNRDTKEIRINPANLRSRMRLGKGQGWMLHAESTVCHEIGHSIFESLTPEKQQEWYDISGWVRTDDNSDTGRLAERYVEKRPGWPAFTSKWRHKKNVGFTRHYAEKSPDEDFADSFSFAILGKGHQMAPGKRKFIEQLVQEKVHR